MRPWCLRSTFWALFSRFNTLPVATRRIDRSTDGDAMCDCHGLGHSRPEHIFKTVSLLQDLYLFYREEKEKRTREKNKRKEKGSTHSIVRAESRRKFMHSRDYCATCETSIFLLLFFSFFSLSSLSSFFFLASKQATNQPIVAVCIFLSAVRTHSVIFLYFFHPSRTIQLFSRKTEEKKL